MHVGVEVFAGCRLEIANALEGDVFLDDDGDVFHHAIELGVRRVGLGGEGLLGNPVSGRDEVGVLGDKVSLAGDFNEGDSRKGFLEENSAFVGGAAGSNEPTYGADPDGELLLCPQFTRSFPVDKNLYFCKNFSSLNIQAIPTLGKAPQRLFSGKLELASIPNPPFKTYLSSKVYCALSKPPILL